MKSTAQFFWKALVIALSFGAGGVAYSQYLKSNTAHAQQRCEAQSRREMVEFNARQPKEAGSWSVAQTEGFLCDPFKLYIQVPSGVIPPGIEGEVLTAYRNEGNGIDKACYSLACLIALIGVLPAIWYFLLARLAEIAGAIRRG